MQRHVGAAQVDGDRLVPFGRRQAVDRRPGAVDARIGNNDVEAAERAGELLDGGAHRCFVRDIRRKRQRRAALSADFGGNRLHLVGAAAQHTDAGAVASERQRGGLADPGSRAGDEGDLSCKQHR